MKKILPLLILAFAPGCAVVAKLPMNRFESPEATGRLLGAEGQVGYQGRNEVVLTNNTAVKGPSFTDPSVETPSHRLMAEGAVGLLERLDVNLTLPAARLGAKYQLLGSPHDKADKGNTSIAVSAGVGFSHDDDSSPTLAPNSLASSQSTYQLDETQWDFALVGGWRAGSDVLIYGGPFTVLDNARTTYTPFTGGVVQNQSGTIKSYGVNIGLQGSIEKVFFRVEGAGTKTKLGNANIGRATYGAFVGVYL